MNPTLKADLKLLKETINHMRAKLKRLEYRKTHREQERVSRRNWTIKNRAKANLSTRNSILKSKYGITTEQYDAMLKNQNYCCVICNKPASAFKQRLHVEHCHKTNKIRGLACVNCNRLLGACEDTIEVLENAINYLKQHGNASLAVIDKKLINSIKYAN